MKNGFFNGLNLVIFFFFAIIITLLKFSVLGLPYHWDSISTALSARSIYYNWLIPIVRDIDVGHPPFFYETIAFGWSIFGCSPLVSNTIVLVFSIFGVYFTFLTGKHLGTIYSAFIASILLFVSPLYFAQSAISNLDLPLTSLLVATLYFALIKKMKLYLLCGISLCLTKAPGLLLIFSLLASLIKEGSRKYIKLLRQELLVFGLPIFIYIAWLSFYKMTPGSFFYPRHFFYRPSEILPFILQLQHIIKAIFIDDYRFLLSAVMLGFIFQKKAAMLKKRWAAFVLFIFCTFTLKVFLFKKLPFLRLELLYLFPVFYFILTRQLYELNKNFLPMLIFLGAAIIAFASFEDCLPRYLVVTYPFYYIIAAYCLLQLLKRLKPAAIGVLVMVLIILSVSKWHGQRKVICAGSGAILESNLEYIDLVTVHQAACRYLEETYPQSSILTSWPQTTVLQHPFLGYITRPLNVIYSEELEKNNKKNFDLIFYSDQSHTALKMRNFLKATELKLQLIKAFERNRKSALLYKVDQKR